MTKITVNLPLETAAAVIAARLATDADLHDMPVDLIRAALIRWSVGELTRVLNTLPFVVSLPQGVTGRLYRQLHDVYTGAAAPAARS